MNIDLDQLGDEPNTGGSLKLEQISKVVETTEVDKLDDIAIAEAVAEIEAELKSETKSLGISHILLLGAVIIFLVAYFLKYHFK